MKSVNELLELFTRQAALEKAMRQRGGARVIEEQELLEVRRRLAQLPAAMGVLLPRDEIVDKGDELVRSP